jgi:hypothetical protein
LITHPQIEAPGIFPMQVGDHWTPMRVRSTIPIEPLLSMKRGGINLPNEAHRTPSHQGDGKSAIRRLRHSIFGINRSGDKGNDHEQSRIDAINAIIKWADAMTVGAMRNAEGRALVEEVDAIMKLHSGSRDDLEGSRVILCSRLR